MKPSKAKRVAAAARIPQTIVDVAQNAAMDFGRCSATI